MKKPISTDDLEMMMAGTVEHFRDRMRENGGKPVAAFVGAIFADDSSLYLVAPDDPPSKDTVQQRMQSAADAGSIMGFIICAHAYMRKVKNTPEARAKALAWDAEHDHLREYPDAKEVVVIYGSCPSGERFRSYRIIRHEADPDDIVAFQWDEELTNGATQFRTRFAVRWPVAEQLDLPLN